MTPIYTTSTYVQQSPGVHKGFDYGRSHNPTRFAFERCVADLEEGTAGFAFASGLAAIATVLELLEHGSHVLVCDDIYGGSYRLFERVRRRQRQPGLQLRRSDATWTSFAAAIRPNTRHDLDRNAVESAAEAGRPGGDRRDRPSSRGIVCVADNTFATPYVQRPLTLGFDIVVHSVTKYLNGHSDMIGGVAVVGENDTTWPSRCGFLQNAVGGISGPFDSFLALRGVKTLALRMERHCENAQQIAEWLARRSDVSASALPRPAEPSAARAGAAADGGVRRHGLGRARRRRSPRAADSWNAASSSRWPKAWAASKA